MSSTKLDVKPIHFEEQMSTSPRLDLMSNQVKVFVFERVCAWGLITQFKEPSTWYMLIERYILGNEDTYSNS